MAEGHRRRGDTLSLQPVWAGGCGSLIRLGTLLCLPGGTTTRRVSEFHNLLCSQGSPRFHAICSQPWTSQPTTRSTTFPLVSRSQAAPAPPTNSPAKNATPNPASTISAPVTTHPAWAASCLRTREMSAQIGAIRKAGRVQLHRRQSAEPNRSNRRGLRRLRRQWAGRAEL